MEPHRQGASADTLPPPRRRNVPLLIGKGSTDAAAWRYSRIFLEPSFALHEIDLHTRILALAQPASVLQWKLTAHYSLLASNGIAGGAYSMLPVNNRAAGKAVLQGFPRR